MAAEKSKVLYAVADDGEYARLCSLLGAPQEAVHIQRARSYHEILTALLAGAFDIYLIDCDFDDGERLQSLRQASSGETDVAMIFLVDEARADASEFSDAPGLSHADIFVRGRFGRADFERALRNAGRHRRLKAVLEYRLKYEQLVNEILSMFIGMEPHEIDLNIQQALQFLGEFAAVDRCYLWQFSPGGASMQKTHQWCAEGAQQQYVPGKDVPCSDLPWLVRTMQSGEVLAYEDIRRLPLQAEKERRYLISAGIRSIVTVPLQRGSTVLGFLGFSAVHRSRAWDQDIIELLQMTARLFINALARRTAEQARRDSEIRFRSVVESLNDGLVLIDRSGRIEYVNSRFTAMTGYTPSESVGCRLFDLLLRAEDLTSTKELGDSEPPAEGDSRRLHIIRKDGTKRWLEIAAAPYRHGTGHSQGAVALLTDITDQKSLEAQLRQSQKMEAVGRLAGGVAHDFNNFLTAVLGYSGLLLQRLPGDHPHRHELSQIRKASEQAGTLVHQLLTFSRKQVMTPRVLSLNMVVEDTARMLKRLIGEDIELEMRLDDSLWPLKADPGQMQQIVLNLAINARDAMPDGGLLSIVTENFRVSSGADEPGMEPGSYVMLRVSDTGCGMDDEVKAHLFEPFFTTKEQGKGTGLGLSTVYGIVQSSGGFIAVTSSPGHGSMFQILFPAVEGEPDSSPLGIRREKLSRGSETVLLVEDEESVRGLLAEVLRTSGYRVLEAADGREAVRLARGYSSAIHLMVTDVVMPYMSGSQAAELVCRERPGTKVLVISGYLHNSAVPRCIAARPCAFLGKPFTPYDFSQVVRQVLDAGPAELQQLSPAPLGLSPVSVAAGAAKLQ